MYYIKEFLYVLYKKISSNVERAFYFLEILNVFSLFSFDELKMDL